jgi:hypothetical protein
MVILELVVVVLDTLVVMLHLGYREQVEGESLAVLQVQ